MSTPSITPSIIDLVDLPTCKNWLGIDLNNTDFDSQIAFLITGFSQWVLNRSGVDSFNTVQHYVEIYDGNGAPRMFVLNTPIVSVNSIIMDGTTLPQSSGLTTSGWFIEQSKKSIAIRTGGTMTPQYRGFLPYTFNPGIGNVQIDYTAGYTRVPFDLQEAAMKAVGINFSRKDWKDLASKSMGAQGATGTTVYQKWILPPEIMQVLEFYSRYARP